MTDREFSIVRTLHASPERVYRAWTEPEHLTWFFSDPAGDNAAPEVDLRVGGEWRQVMVVDDDDSYVTGGVYRDLVPNERLAFAWGALGGWPAIDPDDLDSAPQVTIELRDVDGSTEQTFRLALADTLTDEEVEEELATGMEPGWAATIDRLVDDLNGAELDS